jgi:hypothetical protein
MPIPPVFGTPFDFDHATSHPVAYIGCTSAIALETWNSEDGPARR